MIKVYFLVNDYFATGEGRTVYLYSTACETEEEAKRRFHEDMKIAEYFHIGTQVYDNFDEFVGMHLGMHLTPNTIGLIRKDPSQFFFHFHINLS